MSTDVDVSTIQRWGMQFQKNCSVTGLSFSEKMQICEETKNTLVQITSFMKGRIGQMSAKEETLREQLVTLQRQKNDTQQEIKKLEGDVQTLEKQVRELHTTIEGYERTLTDLDTEITDLEKKKSEAVRKRIIGSVPPGPSNLLSLFSGDFKGAFVPGYNQVAMVGSFIEQDFENAQRRREEKRTERIACKSNCEHAKNELQSKKDKIQAKRNKLITINNEIKRIELEINDAALKREQTTDFHLVFSTAHDKYQALLTGRVESAMKTNVEKKAFELKMNQALKNLGQLTSALEGDTMRRLAVY